MNITMKPSILCRTVLLVATMGACFPEGNTAAMTTNVVFKNFSFTPQTVTIQVGDTVVWSNGGGSHTVTGDGADPFCGSGAVPVSCSETFMNAGSFPYHCNFHQAFGMVGTVMVLPAANVPPTVKIDSPTEGTVFSVPAIVTIQATAEDTDGTVSQVEFFADNN